MELQCRLDRQFEVSLFENFSTHSLATHLAEFVGHHRALLVTTPTVARLYGEALRDTLISRNVDVSLHTLAITEDDKTLPAVQSICQRSQELHLNRHSALIALGGGVCSDTVGFAASMIRRGISYVRVPTTLIGQVDAGVGLKCGVNFGDGKNYLGSFYPPLHVFVAPPFLRTLPAPGLRQGLAEILKMALIRDHLLFEIVDTHHAELLQSGFQQPAAIALRVLRDAIRLMLAELQENPYENLTLERLVDFGHTVSPTLETLSHYSLAHGDAVAIDMAFSCALACELGYLHEAALERILRTLCAIGLPIASALLSADTVAAAFASTSLHRAGRLNLVVPTAIGAATWIRSMNQIPASAIAAALSRIAQAQAELAMPQPAPGYLVSATHTASAHRG